jgi:hypothetical protein
MYLFYTEIRDEKLKTMSRDWKCTVRKRGRLRKKWESCIRKKDLWGNGAWIYRGDKN